MSGGRNDKRESNPDRAGPKGERPPSGATQPQARPGATEGHKGSDAPKPSDRIPPAGPHADPDLTNQDATPGTGTLQPPGAHDDVDSTSG